MALVDFAPPIAAGIIGAATAIVAGQIANKNAERRETRNREADADRERLRDLRLVTDDATIALRDLWTILGSFAYAIPAGDPPESRRSPTEARDPDPAGFVDAYERLTDAHIRLLNRVEWGDTFQDPVGRAVIDTQAAFNAVVEENPFEPREPKSRNAIMKANGTVQHALRELQATARDRFAPLGIPDARYAVVLIVTVKQGGARTDEILGALRLERHAKVLGPDKDGRVVVRDDEAREGEARLRLRGSLRKLADDWETYLRVEPPGEAELKAWRERRARQQSGAL
jgi:hypothetical protein